MLPKIMKQTLFFLLAMVLIAACNNSKDMMENTKEALLLVGTYTDKEGHVNGQAEGIYGLKFNSESGSLRSTELKVKTTNPSYIAIDSKSKTLYAVNEKVGDGQMLSSFSLTDTSINILNQVDALGGAPCHITVHDTYVFTANYVGGNHAVYKVNPDGTLGDSSQLIQNVGSGPSPRQEGPHAHMISRNPHTNDFITVDLGTDKISFYDFNADQGKLVEKFVLHLEEGSGPRHLDFHPTKDIIYIVNELRGNIVVLKSAELGYEVVQAVDATSMGEPRQAGCAAIHIHPNGKYLYSSNRGPYNSISQFKIDDEGLVEMIGEIPSGGLAPRDFAIDPSGSYLLAANQNSDNIVVFEIKSNTGELIKTSTVVSAPTPVCLKFL